MTVTSAVSTRRTRRVQGRRRAGVAVRVDRFEEACTSHPPRVAVATMPFVTGGAPHLRNFRAVAVLLQNVARAAADGSERGSPNYCELFPQSGNLPRLLLLREDGSRCPPSIHVFLRTRAGCGSHCFAWGFLEGHHVSVTFPRQVTASTMSANTLLSDPQSRVKAAKEITPIAAPAPLLDVAPSDRGC